MKPLNKYLEMHQTGVAHIVAESCMVIIASQGDANDFPVSPALNPTRTLNPGDKVELCKNYTTTTGIRIKIKEEYIWIEIDELKKIKVKGYEELSDEEIKYIVKQITRSSNSEDEVRQKIMDELDYPFSKEGIAVHRLSRAMCSVMLWSSKGEGLMV